VPVVQDGEIKGIVSRGDMKGMELEEYQWKTAGSMDPPGEFRSLGSIVTGQKPAVGHTDETVHDTCRVMRRRKSGSVLVLDKQERLAGIFTGRDAVRILARAKDPAATRLSRAMTRDPVTIAADSNAIEALRLMDTHGFRHLPVIDESVVLGVVSRSDFTGIELDRLEEEQHLWESIW
jgi:CBS domain-containing protein